MISIFIHLHIMSEILSNTLVWFFKEEHELPVDGQDKIINSFQYKNAIVNDRMTSVLL